MRVCKTLIFFHGIKRKIEISVFSEIQNMLLIRSASGHVGLLLLAACTAQLSLAACFGRLGAPPDFYLTLIIL